MRPFLSLILLIGIIFLSSCEELLEVTDISDQELNLLAPSDSVVVTQNEVRFSWNEVFEANSYHVQVAQPNFENAVQVVIDTLVVVDSTYLGSSFVKPLSDSSYEWRVKAMNSDFETEYKTHAFWVESTKN
ncbi:hypothetical protein PP182_18395 [Maribacter sp. PR1]|uniref:Fibronectin type-III domain-containing protein n=1 Tax=Maribacter cobaltidurans TaxID=1178778 RepID=A0ABU7IYJ4_9FLAO|nr:MULTISPECIES: hypothetical protein [Maribacter]MDC6390663.1 hypothetical protein [Maribacter sp. PR1]MEE1978055.1 hypothetical protein [Maribacter cobaltidurans]